MKSWWQYLRGALGRTLPEDRLTIGGAASGGVRGGFRALDNLRPFLERYWRNAILGGLVILAASALAFPQPLIQRYLIDDVILAQRLSQLWVGVALLAAVKMTERVLGSYQQVFFSRLEQEVMLDIQGDLFARTLRLPKSFFDEQEVGYLMSRLSSDVQGLRWFFSSTLVYMLTNLLRFVGGVAFIFYLNWQLALVALLAIPGLAIGMYRFARQIRVLRHQGMEQHARVSQQMQESLATASLIKSFSAEERTTDRLVLAMRESFDIAMEQTILSSVAGLAIQSLPDISRAIILLAGGFWVIQGEWTLGSLLAFQSYVGYVHGPAQYLGTVNLQLQSALAALERVSALYDIVPEDNLGHGTKVQRLRGAVAFREVSFAYDGRDPVLSDVSFAVQPGERVAIVGPSGVGKTTLISLLLRFYRPTSGEIWFDGQPASAYELGSLRRRIGYVSQKTLLLSGTVGENLRYGNPIVAQEAMDRAVQAAGLQGFIASLPDGYDTLIGEGGVKLSEGQKQRLSIARALIVDPDILVLDEPTSALDSLTERSILDALPSLVRGKTIFVVAHRLSTVRDADRILLLTEKKLADMGTHAELLERNAYYRSWVANQVSGPPGDTTAGDVASTT